MLMINEVSTFIWYQRAIGEKKLLEQINAIVSHEMRNPLNSILAMISKIIYYKDLMLVSVSLHAFPEEFRVTFTENLREITASTLTLESSSKLLDFTVNDMLTLGQIESSKFRLNLSVFDIREAVKVVMGI